MALPQIGTKAEPQIIPTNAGLRTFAAPPQALQQDIVPNDLFYIRNHWTDSPEIDINTFQLKIDGEVDRTISLSFEDLKNCPRSASRSPSSAAATARCPIITPNPCASVRSWSRSRATA